jgi:hypothetical protein
MAALQTVVFALPITMMQKEKKDKKHLPALK